MRAIDLSGKRFGMLRVLAPDDDFKTNRKWLCVCDCGKTSTIRGDVIRDGRQKSCGCRRGGFRHGRSNTSIHWIWQNMMSRCYKESHHAYQSYGGRGIKVCDRWHKFDNFLADMGDRPAGKSLDRIDNSKGYSPGNCRWATQKEQCRNMRTNKMIEIDGIVKSLAEWCEELGQPYERISKRIQRGIDQKEALIEKRTFVGRKWKQ